METKRGNLLFEEMLAHAMTVIVGRSGGSACFPKRHHKKIRVYKLLIIFDLHVCLIQIGVKKD